MKTTDHDEQLSAAQKSSKIETENFRAAEIRFLQEQNKQVLSALERAEEEREDALVTVKEWEGRALEMQSDMEALQKKMEAIERQSNQSITDVATKEEHIKVLSEQNRQLLQLLEQEEGRHREKAVMAEKLTIDNERMTVQLQELQKRQESGDEALGKWQEEVDRLSTGMRTAQAEADHLRAALTALEAQSKVDLEAMEQALSVAKKKNVQYLQQVQSHEVAQRRLQTDLNRLLEEKLRIEREKKELFDQLQAATAGREQDGRRATSRGGKSGEGDGGARLQQQVDMLKKALHNVERANEKLQEENKSAAEKHREMTDKVYSLMDSLRLNQLEHKKVEADNNNKTKKVLSVEKQLQGVQSRLNAEIDAKQAAEQSAREAIQEKNLTDKRMKQIEEESAACRKELQGVEQKLQELIERNRALDSQVHYLSARVEGQEEDKAQLRVESRKLEASMKEMGKERTSYQDRIGVLEERLHQTAVEKDQLRSELDYIKREDFLDETGRTRPLLIHSTESTLVDRLKLNEFLYRAQQGPNPVPVLVEKIAQLLEMLHVAQTQADQYLTDLARANQTAAAMRQKNLVLYEKYQWLEDFRTKVVSQVIANILDSTDGSHVNLAGLQLDEKMLETLLELSDRERVSEVADRLQKLNLSRNGLLDQHIPPIIQLLMRFPYLRRLDLSGNCLSYEGIKRLEDAVGAISGITLTQRIANPLRIEAHSGHQLRLCILTEGQEAPPPQSQIPLDDVTSPDGVPMASPAVEDKDMGPELSSSSIMLPSTDDPTTGKPRPPHHTTVKLARSQTRRITQAGADKAPFQRSSTYHHQAGAAPQAAAPARGSAVSLPKVTSLKPHGPLRHGKSIDMGKQRSGDDVGPTTKGDKGDHALPKLMSASGGGGGGGGGGTLMQSSGWGGGPPPPSRSKVNRPVPLAQAVKGRSFDMSAGPAPSTPDVGSVARTKSFAHPKDETASSHSQVGRKSPYITSQMSSIGAAAKKSSSHKKREAAKPPTPPPSHAPPPRPHP
ncbi:unnamed protein product [Vitrella brassicaformis CCMP3155]|uniref:Uncharacterized protein n=4 Tax=Vitrella brassicaformis TaxID=1169539 RepID=A0A0G4G8H4_VITBC|nr:unnamed protein product [Vitrella brassicaformis CCMP3155]|eukprot:CEM25182.1 unnamed protein product [Vitrella brassicaformis CCMP3155]